jgi:archaeosine synthase beta-subunit
LALGYPLNPDLRSEWVLGLRPQRTILDPDRPYNFHVEDERSPSGEIVPVATIFLTNRECPWRCVMCDLWKNTLTEPVTSGAIPRQIAYALERLPAARQIKLYNSGSFFDSQAIPPQDYGEIAKLVTRFDRTIVECHPALIGMRCVEFSDLLGNRLEVAMGLETVHPGVLERLNKRMTLEQFRRSAEFLCSRDIDLRIFILVQPPFMSAEDALEWTQRSLAFAFASGATAASLIPTRSGNGAIEVLAQTGEFHPPRLATLESAFAYGIGLKRGRVFADLWDLHRATPGCPHCYPARIARLHAMNLRQEVLEPADCAYCGGAS